MKPSEMRSGDRIILGEGRGRRYVQVMTVEETEQIPGLAEFTFTAMFADGSCAMLARNKDYKTWQEKK